MPFLSETRTSIWRRNAVESGTPFDNYLTLIQKKKCRTHWRLRKKLKQAWKREEIRRMSSRKLLMLVFALLFFVVYRSFTSIFAVIYQICIDHYNFFFYTFYIIFIFLYLFSLIKSNLFEFKLLELKSSIFLYFRKK